MIQINDYDQPIQVAQKLVTGTKIVTLNTIQKTIRSVMVNDNSAEAEFDMFSLEEIKEIIDHLTIYYKAHKDGDSE